MKALVNSRRILQFAAAAVLACFLAQPAAAQNVFNPDLPLRFGRTALSAQFHTNPLLDCFRSLRAGGEFPDPNLPSRFGKVDLKSGFMPDPFVKQILVGGGKEVVRAGVKMYIHQQPTFKLYFTNGSNAPLRFYVRCGVDTTLLIRPPNSTSVADDDSGGNENPLITINSPPSGVYNIWVGTTAGGATAYLYITQKPVTTPIPNP